ncbi:hypothetical protein XENORESO_014488 [Xenotaenia resolanae]|uniref:Uncharacterized protein n=1 Tax=Xenotaenia resolanae TaxID=208358 RepID=A0ABV0WLH9_9TELE
MWNSEPDMYLYGSLAVQSKLILWMWRRLTALYSKVFCGGPKDALKGDPVLEDWGQELCSHSWHQIELLSSARWSLPWLVVERRGAGLGTSGTNLWFWSVDYGILQHAFQCEAAGMAITFFNCKAMFLNQEKVRLLPLGWRQSVS